MAMVIYDPLSHLIDKYMYLQLRLFKLLCFVAAAAADPIVVLVSIAVS